VLRRPTLPFRGWGTMTRTTKDPSIVRLSGRDWFGLLGIFITIMIVVCGAYLRHDRLIIEVLTRQQTITDRLDRLETQIDETITARRPD
jgi:hypothetical protein